MLCLKMWNYLFELLKNSVAILAIQHQFFILSDYKTWLSEFAQVRTNIKPKDSIVQLHKKESTFVYRSRLAKFPIKP